MNKIKKLNFDKNDNNKLLSFHFLTVVPPISLFETGEKFQIKINNNHFCYAEVLMKKDLLFNEVISHGYNYLDAGLAENDYYEYICSKFKNKKWWNGKETILSIVFFKKITQLNLFDNNEQLDSTR